MTVQSVPKVYIQELIEGERALAHSEAELNAARAKFELASRKYGATRDWITQCLGNPYSIQFEWPVDVETDSIDEDLWGKYRFINMQVGDAIKEVLREAGQPLDLSEIVSKLNKGKMRTNPRAVNAALMKATGVAKNNDDKYAFNESDVDDLPF